MSYSSGDELRGIVIQTGDEHLLLPNATVAEVMSQVGLVRIPSAPEWLPGRVAWHGWDVPLVSFSRFSGLGNEPIGVLNKIVVLKTLSGSSELPYFALLTQSFPQLVSVPREGLLIDASEGTMPRGVLMRVLLGEQHALLPDLDMIESKINTALSASI